MTAALQPAAPQKKPLRDIFNHFARDAVERFPHLKGHLLIMDLNECSAYGCEDIDTEKTDLTPSQAKMCLDNHPTTIKMMLDKNISSGAWCAPSGRVKIIFINNRIDENELDNVSVKTEKNILSTLDHELAHLAIEGAYGSKDLHEQIIQECIADAYALLRHYQRFGVDSKYRDLKHNPLTRITDMIFHDGKIHFTTFVQDEVIKRRHLIDFDRLDPAEAAALAWRLAKEYAPPAALVETMHATFEPVRAAIKTSPAGSQEWIKTLVDVVLNPESDYYTFKIGSRLLGKYLEDRTLISGHPITLPAEYLDEASQKLKEMEFKFAQQAILFGMPTMAAKPQPAPANHNAPVRAVK